jgi:hypothetical protein
MTTRVYLDHNATTPLDPAVADTMSAALREVFGNPSSIHQFGQRAKTVVDEARTDVAALLGGESSEIVFTSGGTEADNLAIRGAALALAATGRRHLVASAIEHEAVLATLEALAHDGFGVDLLPVSDSGVVSVDSLRRAIRDDTALVSVMHANNEIGTIQPLADLARVAHDHGALFTATPSSPPANSRWTSAPSASTSRPSPRTSSTAPRAWAPSGCARHGSSAIRQEAARAELARRHRERAGIAGLVSLPGSRERWRPRPARRVPPNG